MLKTLIRSAAESHLDDHRATLATLLADRAAGKQVDTNLIRQYQRLVSDGERRLAQMAQEDLTRRFEQSERKAQDQAAREARSMQRQAERAAWRQEQREAERQRAEEASLREADERARAEQAHRQEVTRLERLSAARAASRRLTLMREGLINAMAALPARQGSPSLPPIPEIADESTPALEALLRTLTGVEQQLLDVQTRIATAAALADIDLSSREKAESLAEMLDRFAKVRLGTVTAEKDGGSGDRAATPYVIGGDGCWTAAQLGVALAKHWQVALKDLGRGLPRKWCTTELRSVALERLFMDLEESTDDPNDKLLDLILHLCPDIPPCYRGESLASKTAIAALLERAGSASRSDDAERARAIIKELRKGLLNRFQLQEADEIAAVRTRFQEILDLHSEGCSRGVGPDAFASPDIEQGGIKYPGALQTTPAAAETLELAIALEPELVDRIRAEAKAFAAGTAFRFWFHECVERGMQPSVPVWDTVLLKEHVALARHWYGEACRRIWTPRLSVPFLAPAWRALIEARFDLAWQVARDVDRCLASCASRPLEPADLAAALGLSPDSVDGSPEGRQELLEALAVAREGRDEPLQAWIAEVRRQADPDVIEGLQRLSDTGLDRQVRALVHSHVKRTTSELSVETGRLLRWSSIGLLTQALCSLETRGQAIARVLSAVGTDMANSGWLGAAREQLCHRAASVADAERAHQTVKDFLRAGTAFEERLAQLCRQASTYPNAAKSIFAELAPQLRPFSDRSANGRALHALELVTDSIVDCRFPDTIGLHGYVRSVAFRPDGQIIASAGDSTVQLRDAATGALLRTLEGHGESVHSVAFSPDGRVIASGSYDKTLRLWDTTTGAPLRTLEGHGQPVRSVAFSPDGRVIASGSNDETVRLWDTASGALLRTLEGHSNSVLAVAYSPDGRVIASGSNDKTVRLWDAATGELRRTLEGHGESVCSVAFSPDGRVIASGSNDKTVRLWDAATGELRRTLEGHGESVCSVAFSPDGRVIASGSNDKTVRLWDAATGSLRRTFEGHSHLVESVAFNPDGRVIASGSKDATIHLWDAVSGALLLTLAGPRTGLASVAVSPDGSVIASASSGGYRESSEEDHLDRTIRLWDTTTGALLRTLEGHGESVCSVAFSPDGRVIASGSNDKTVRLWNAATGELRRTLEGHSESVRSVAFSPDGRVIASSSNDKTVRLWDAATGALLRTLEGHGELVPSVAFSPDGRVIASGSNDKTVRLWDAATGALIRTLEGHAISVGSIAFSPDGRVIVSAEGHTTIRLWDAATGAPLRKLERGLSGYIYSVAFSPDGRVLASGGRDFHLWDAVSGTLLRTLSPKEFTDFVVSIAFSADGRLMVSGTHYRGAIQLWVGANSDRRTEVNLLRARLLSLMFLTSDLASATATTNPTSAANSQSGLISEGTPPAANRWRGPLVVTAAILLVFLVLYYLKSPQVKPTQAGGLAAAEVARVDPTRTASAPGAPLSTPRDATSSAPPPPQATAPAAAPTTPEQFDQKLGALASLFDLKQAVAAIDEMISASVVQDPDRVERAAAVIAALEKPVRGERRTARVLNAKALEALPSAPIAAVGLLHDAAEADPADAEILGNLAAAYLKAGLPREALRAAMISLALTPRRASTWGTLALSAFALDMPEAISLAAFHNAYRYAGNPEKSVEYLTTLATDDPDPRIRAFAEKTLTTLSEVERIEPTGYAR